jgi:drug/metabolite transporter (DMT)-like permease
MSATRPAARSGDRLAYAAVLLQTAIAAATSLVAKATLALVPPFPLTMLRLILASVLMALVVGRGWRRLAAVPPLELGQMVLLGALGITVNQGAFLRGLEESTPARSALLYALTPIVVLVVGRLRGRERLTPAKVVGLVLAFIGVALILLERDVVSGATLRGDLLVLLAVLAWSAYTAFGRSLLAAHGTLLVTGVGLVSGTVFFLPVGAPALAHLDLGQVPLAGWAGVVFLAAFSSVAAYTLWYYAIARLPPSRVAVFMNLQAPLVVLTAWLLWGERVSLAFVSGALLVLAGVRVAQRGPS